MRVRSGRVGLPQSRMMWSMADNSLGRSVAVTALAPIAGRLVEERERAEREAEGRRAEKKAVERKRSEREARIREGVATSADLAVIREEAAVILTRDSSPGNVRQVWNRLVASGAVGDPTHDLLRVQVKGKNSRVTATELSRTAAWLAPDAGEWEGRTSEFEQVRLNQIDAWVDRDGGVWIPSTPHPQGYGLLHLERDNRGRIYGPDALMVLLPHGASLRIKKTWEKWSDGQVAGGIVLSSETGPGPMRNRHGLREAVGAILEARGVGAPLLTS